MSDILVYFLVYLFDLIYFTYLTIMQKYSLKSSSIYPMFAPFFAPNSSVIVLYDLFTLFVLFVMYLVHLMRYVMYCIHLVK